MIKDQEEYEVMQICKEFLYVGINGKVPTTEAMQKTKLLAAVDQIFQKYFTDAMLGLHDFSTSQASDDHIILQSLKASSNQADLLHSPNNDDIWIFGYGSLVWKADFPFIDRRPGFIRGYQRRFYQNSIDHRGTPQKPGRVVTLLPTGRTEDRVYGVAYRIPAQERQYVLAHLDYREKNGYERCTLKFQVFPEEPCQRFDVIMYIATSANESFAGDVWQQHKIAEQIATSTGPSGSNREYLFNLANAMRALFPGIDDKHLFHLEQEVRRIVEREELLNLEKALKKDIANILAKAINGRDGYKGEMDGLLKELRKLRDDCCNRFWKETIVVPQQSTDND